MDEHSWHINDTLSNPNRKAWWREKEPHLYMWFMFEATPFGSWATFLEKRILKRLFDTFEFHESRDKIVLAQFGVFFLTNAKGLY